MSEHSQWAIKQHIEKYPKCEWLCTHNDIENLGEVKEQEPSTPTTSVPEDGKLDVFVESWIPINVKDAQHVKLAKIEARKELVGLIESYGNHRELEGRKDQTFKVVQGLVKSGSISDLAASTSISLYTSDAYFNRLESKKEAKA